MDGPAKDSLEELLENFSDGAFEALSNKENHNKAQDILPILTSGDSSPIDVLASLVVATCAHICAMSMISVEGTTTTEGLVKKRCVLMSALMKSMVDASFDHIYEGLFAVDKDKIN